MNTTLLCMLIATAILEAVSLALRVKKSKLEKDWPCRLQHSPVPIQSQILKTESGGSYTILLKRCSECGTHNIESFPGSWTLADFVRTESCLDELERIGAK